MRSRPGVGEDLPIELTFDDEVIDELLGEARARLQAPPRDARFEVDRRDRITIVPSRSGTLVDARQVAAAVLEAATTPLRRGILPIETGAQPSLSTEQAEALQIRELVSKYTTVHPCCRPRVKNIHLVAELLDGAVVKPGEVLSVNERVGRRTRRKGFVPAPTIEDGEMVDTVGGGISQFATTLFNAALRGGYDVLHRTPHSFYFSRYPMGWDATLSYPKPDLVIRNSTTAGLLIKTEHTAASITVKLYGDDGGCQVRLRRSSVMDVVKPPVMYHGNPDIDPDDEKVRTKGVVGWSVEVTRTRSFADGSQRQDRRKVTYQPRPREVEVHPCQIPKGEVGYTGERCPEPDEEADAASPERAGAGGAGSAEELIPPSLLGPADGGA